MDGRLAIGRFSSFGGGGGHCDKISQNSRKQSEPGIQTVEKRVPVQPDDRNRAS